MAKNIRNPKWKAPFEEVLDVEKLHLSEKSKICRKCGKECNNLLNVYTLENGTEWEHINCPILEIVELKIGDYAQELQQEKFLD